MPSKIRGRNKPGARGSARDSQRVPVDTLHVECIRSALSRNEYVIDGRRIADRLHAFERQLAVCKGQRGSSPVVSR